MKTQILKEFILKEAFKILGLFVAGLYLLGFVWFPLLGVGNYQLVRVDFLLPSEWILISVLALTLIGWSFLSLSRLSKALRTVDTELSDIKAIRSDCNAKKC